MAERSDPLSLGSSPATAGGSRSLVGRLTWAVGCVALLLAADLGIGTVWNRVAPDEVLQADNGGQVFTDHRPRDPRNDEPAMAAYPWRARYFEDIQRTNGGYWPFTEFRPLDFSSPYVNQRGWVRESYEPKGDASTMPMVWMFGGSTTWGEGQRDQHTIASEIARLADDAGTPLRINNYGQRGWTHFQEMVLYEQRLALEGPPDISLFYDGLNEITTQSLLNEAVPSHTLVQQYARKLTGTTIATQFIQSGQDSGAVSLGTLANFYKAHSAINRAAHWLQVLPAGASPAESTGSTQSADDGTDDDGLGKEFTPDQDSKDGVVTNYKMTDQDGIDAGKVYIRGRDITLGLSEKYGVTSLFFWQPARYNGPPQEKAIAQLTPPTIDISKVLEGHDDVFIDGGHTNEEGARIVAEVIWKRLQPIIDRWYEEHR